MLWRVCACVQPRLSITNNTKAHVSVSDNMHVYIERYEFPVYFSGNQCFLRIAICRAHQKHDTLILAHNGSCNPLDQLNERCDSLCDEEGSKQFCGSDGNTYGE